ncbi:MAG: rhodanese-like domain-containing protein [Myxococcota bacterium]
MKTIDSATLADSLGHPRLLPLDLRSPDSFNGWRLRGEQRGGHIPGSRNLPFRWTSYLDWPELVESKGLDRGSRVVLYGATDEENAKVGERLLRMGFTDVCVYRDFVSEWCADYKRPLEKLPRYRNLVPPDYLRGPARRTEGSPESVLCHAYYRDRGVYESAHIPGAVALDTELLESPADWNRRCPQELDQALRGLGISQDTRVVLYGECGTAEPDDPFPGSRAGQLAAMRCAFIMLYAGVKDVRVLNGGLGAWREAGYPTTTEATQPSPISEFGLEIPAEPGFAVDMPEAKRILASPGANLVCVRSRREYLGEVSGYNYIDKAGRIPGAVFADCGSDAYHMESYRNPDQTMRSFHEISGMWARSGILPDAHNAFYCGTGWRGSEAFFYAWLMGWNRVSVFDGGWLEWSSDPSSAWETGDPWAAAAETSSRAAT